MNNDRAGLVETIKEHGRGHGVPCAILPVND
jgi:hypothetical protein